MRALWLEQGALRFRRDVPPPECPDGEARIRLTRVGICQTDIELTRGYYPFTGVPGHEFVGVVEEGPAEWVGKRVVGEINAACGTCRLCDKGIATHCLNRTVLGIVNRHGAFAEYLSLPAGNLHHVPDRVPDDVAVFTEPLAASLEVLEQVPISASDRVVVVGDGKLGQLVARVIARTGCELMVVGRHPEKLALLEPFDIATGRKAPERWADVAVECTGNAEGFHAARSSVRPRGTLVMKSTYAGALTIDASSVVVDEITLIGSRCGPFAPALALLASGAVDPAPLIEARYPLESGSAAFAHAERRGALKVLVEVS